MTATFVASSSPMFSSAFGQPTRPATVNPFANNNSSGQGNPFAPNNASDSSSAKRTKRPSPFAEQSDNEGKRPSKNPFSSNLNSGDEGKKFKKGDDKRKNHFDTKKGRVNGGDHAKKPAFQNARNNGLKPSTSARPTSSSSAGSDDIHFPEPRNSNDPHSRQVYEQLRKDGIDPPSWPSQPGHPKSKAEVTKFREQYEAYRSKVRVSLTNAGLIDDPSKRKTLQDAIDFKGICEDMCPEYEKITRINEMDVNQPEKNSKTGFPNIRRMVKKLARSAAGQEAPLPMDVRSVPALRRTLDYLVDDLLQNDDNLPGLHGFLWDRTRAIRRDFTFFSSLTPEEMKIQVYVLENIARFHVTALHLLSQEGKAAEDFVEQQELEQLGKALLSLRDLYDDCNEQGIACENEPEFRAYYLVFHAFDPNIIETLQRQWKPNLWRDSDEVRTAVSLVESLQNTDQFHGPLKDAPSLAASAAYHTYFRIVEDPKVSYTMACFAECHFPHLRRSILTTIKKAFSRPRESPKDMTASVLNKYLRFDTVQEAIEFGELHGLEFGECEEDPSDIGRRYLILDKTYLPHRRLQHQFSHNVVEKKRGSRPLPDLIHQTIYEDPSAPKTNGSVEESLFVSDSESEKTATTPASFPAATTKPSPFSPFGPPSGLLPNNVSNTPTGTTSNGSLSTPNSVFQQSSKPNPFASASPLGTQKPNPFDASQPQKSSIQALNSSGNSVESPSHTTTPFPAGNPFASSLTKPLSNGDSQAASPFSQPSIPASGTSQALKPNGLSPFASTFSPNGITLGQSSAAKTAEPQDISSSQLQPATPPGISIIPPTPKSTSLSSFLPNTSASTSSTSSTAPLGTQPTPELTNGEPKPTPSVANRKTDDGAPVSAPSIPTAATPTFHFPGTTQPSTTKPISTSSIADTKPPSPLPNPPAPLLPPTPPVPPRDLMRDLTKWFVLGDEGLLADFQAFMLESILQSVFTDFQVDQKQKRQQEEEERAIAEAREFRVYSLSVKYFYRWRDNARERRLKQLRRSGRDQMRAFHDAQRVAQQKAQKAATKQAAREQAELAQLDRPEEFRKLLKHKNSKRQAEDALRASGVLSGVSFEDGAISRVVDKQPSIAGSVTSNRSSSSRLSLSHGGSKTQALRKQLLGDEPASFRRSLPPMSARDASNSGSELRVSKVSERWRLKAMGMVQMSDGSVLPESLARDGHYVKTRPQVGSMGPPANPTTRRASISGITSSDGRLLSSPQGKTSSKTTDITTTKNKRKRLTEDEPELNNDSNANAHKRVMSDAQILMNELKAMREEMEEGATWFRDQNEKLQSELESRASTPWDESN